MRKRTALRLDKLAESRAILLPFRATAVITGPAMGLFTIIGPSYGAESMLALSTAPTTPLASTVTSTWLVTYPTRLGVGLVLTCTVRAVSISLVQLCSIRLALRTGVVLRVVSVLFSSSFRV